MHIPKWVVFVLVFIVVGATAFYLGQKSGNDRRDVSLPEAVEDAGDKEDAVDVAVSDADADVATDGVVEEEGSEEEAAPEEESPEEGGSDDETPDPPGGGFVLPELKTDFDSETTEPLPAAQVRYRSSFGLKRFSPSEIRIKVGQTVVWKNETSGGMRVASDPHPAHTSYPEFNQKSGGSGEWSFTFDEEGVWSYHNHAKPSVTGRVIVEN